MMPVAQVDLARGELLINLAAAGLLLEVAKLYAEYGRDDDLASSVASLVERMRAAIAAHKKLESARAEAARSAEANTEYRVQRGAA